METSAKRLLAKREPKGWLVWLIGDNGLQADERNQAAAQGV